MLYFCAISGSNFGPCLNEWDLGLSYMNVGRNFQLYVQMYVEVVSWLISQDTRSTGLKGIGSNLFLMDALFHIILKLICKDDLKKSQSIFWTLVTGSTTATSFLAISTLFVAVCTDYDLYAISFEFLWFLTKMLRILMNLYGV